LFWLLVGLAPAEQDDTIARQIAWTLDRRRPPDRQRSRAGRWLHLLRLARVSVAARHLRLPPPAGC
jgi:hypothetical protein